MSGQASYPYYLSPLSPVPTENKRAEDRKAVLRRVDMELDEADEMVSQMEIEIQGMPPSIRPSYQTRLKTAKTELARFKKLLKDQHSQLARADLLSSSKNPFTSSDDPYGTNANAKSDRARLLAGTNILEAVREGSRSRRGLRWKRRTRARRS